MSITASIKKGFAITVSSLVIVLILLAISVAFNLATQGISAQIQTALAPFSDPASTQDFSALAPVIPLALAFFILNAVLNALTDAGSVAYLHEKIKTGNSSISHFFNLSGKNFLKFFVLFLIYILFGILVLIVVATPIALAAGAAAAAKGNQLVTGISLAIGVIAAVAALGFAIYKSILFFSMAPYIMVAKNTGVKTAVADSAIFVKKHFMDVLGIAAVLFLVALLFIGLGFVTGMVAGLITGSQATGQLPGPVDMVVGVVFGFLFVFINIVSKAAFLSYYLGSEN